MESQSDVELHMTNTPAFRLATLLGWTCLDSGGAQHCFTITLHHILNVCLLLVSLLHIWIKWILRLLSKFTSQIDMEVV